VTAPANDPAARAFPSGAIDDRYGGMALRDYFAGQALPPLVAKGITPAGAAAIAYAIADAMLAERNR